MELILATKNKYQHPNRQHHQNQAAASKAEKETNPEMLKSAIPLMGLSPMIPTDPHVKMCIFTERYNMVLAFVAIFLLNNCFLRLHSPEEASADSVFPIS